jgi:hypothetical protein
MLRLKWILLMLRHHIYYTLSGGKKAAKEKRITGEVILYPDYVLILQSKYFMWWIPTGTYRQYRKRYINKKLNIK